MSQIIRISELPAFAGRELEVSSWLEISQQRINQFADATNDHQFIHVDQEQAARTPFGGTIAHGLLLLSIAPFLLEENTIRPEGLVMGVNYGSDKVRYLQPVRAGQRVRAHQTILQITQKNSTNWLFKILVSLEIENSEKPALIAELLLMYIIE